MTDLTPAEHFFHAYAGWSWDPKTETETEGRLRCARKLAEAESLYIEAHRVADVYVSWSHDSDAALDAKTDGTAFDTCEVACLMVDGELVGSLGGILDAEDHYRRVIRAELAAEASDALRTAIERAEA